MVFRQLYGSSSPSYIAAFTKLSAAWAPFRTWASVLLRSIGPLLLNWTLSFEL